MKVHLLDNVPSLMLCAMYINSKCHNKETEKQ